MEFYNKVTHRQYSGGKAPANMAVFMEQERKLREERAKQASELKKTTEANDRIMRRFASNDQAKRILLEAQKKQVIAELYNYIPLCIMNEVFSRIMLKALPHDVVSGLPNITPIFILIWFMNIHIVPVLAKTHVNFLSHCDIILACNHIYESHISHSTSALGTNAATESITISLTAQDFASSSAICSACSPKSG